VLADRGAPGSGRQTIAIRFGEFVALIAAMMSIQAIAIDAMLPAIPTIAGALRVSNPNHGQWIVTTYMAGLGTGQLVWGVLSDRFGRRPILLGGMALYFVAALVCGLTRSFEALLAWRFVHGLAAASVTVIRSVVRDLYAGRRMARVLSLTFMVFLTVPVLAPSLGQLILWMATWRSIFIACGMFAAIIWVCAFLRLPETLHPDYRLTLDPRHIAGAVRLVLLNRTSMFYTLAMTVMFGSLIAYVATVQQIFADVFHRPSLMPGMFALCAGFMGLAAFTNSRLVERLGMRLISHSAMLVFVGISALHVGIAMRGGEHIWTFVVLQAATMATFSLSVSNFGAMAMEPMGAVAGIGASLQGCISTGFAALVATVIGREFDASTLPLAAGSLGCGLVALAFVLVAEKGRLFHGQHAALLESGLAH
jgi:DHA1 family bicyclomycin/chloramphenicol resistance-like MFS transporter